MRQAYDYWQDQPGFCVPSAADEGASYKHRQPRQSQKASAQRVRIRTRHRREDQCTNAWLTLSEAEAGRQAQQNASFSGQSLPGKQAPTLRISQNQRLPSGCEHTSRNQMQTDESNHPPSTPSVTCRRRRMPSLQGCGPVNLSREAVSRPRRRFRGPNRPREAVLRPQSTSGGDFAAPVDLGRQFCDPGRPRRPFFASSTSGSGFATPVDLERQFFASRMESQLPAPLAKQKIEQSPPLLDEIPREIRKYPGFCRPEIS